MKYNQRDKHYDELMLDSFVLNVEEVDFYVKKREHGGCDGDCYEQIGVQHPQYRGLVRLRVRVHVNMHQTEHFQTEEQV